MKKTMPPAKSPQMPAGKYTGTMNEYDAKRPKRQVMTRKAK